MVTIKRLLATALLVPFIATAQDSKIGSMFGYKAIEINYDYQNEDFLNFGVAISAIESSMVEKREERNDVYIKDYEIENSYVPALFFTVGGTFDKFTITGKLGSAYLDQKVNEIKDDKNFYLAVGCRFEYQVKERLSITSSYDNVNSLLVGINYKL